MSVAPLPAPPPMLAAPMPVPTLPAISAPPSLPMAGLEETTTATEQDMQPIWPIEENYGQKSAKSIAVPVAPPVPEPKLPGWLPSHKARIAIVIDDMGLNLRESRRAVALPASVTLSYIPYAPRLRDQTREARDVGHELMLHMPMEPIGHDNPGPGALLTGLSEDEIRQRLVQALSSFVGFDGVNNHMGSKFTASESGMEIVVEELKQRQLFFLDSRTSSLTVGEKVARREGLPVIARDVFLDDSMTLEAVRGQIQQLERVARRKGYAVAIGHPHQATLQALEKWMPEAEKRGFVFVAIRDLVEQLSGVTAVSAPAADTAARGLVLRP
ncbi:MAG: divergent polysaccharide deacetylase family protein [Bdellovibrionales bacterium]